MKNWLKKYGGYILSVICGVLGLISFGGIFTFSDALTRFIFTMVGFTSLTISVGLASNQYNSNKKVWIVKNEDLKEEDLTNPYEQPKRIEKVKHYSNNYIIENTHDNTNNNETDLTL